MPRTLVVGDIHGCYHELLDLLDKVGLNDEDQLIGVGDLVDRGSDPVAVVQLFMFRPNTIAVRGNHEHAHLRGNNTLPFRHCRAQMGPFFRTFLDWAATLPFHHETPEVRVVHWAALSGVPLDALPVGVRVGLPDGEDFLRARFGEIPWYEHYTDDVPVAFGHRVLGSTPLVVRDRAYGLDTGACHGRRLSGLLLPERRVVSVPSRGDHWSAVTRAVEASSPGTSAPAAGVG